MEENTFSSMGFLSHFRTDVHFFSTVLVLVLKVVIIRTWPSRQLFISWASAREQPSSEDVSERKAAGVCVSCSARLRNIYQLVTTWK